MHLISNGMESPEARIPWVCRDPKIPMEDGEIIRANDHCQVKSLLSNPVLQLTFSPTSFPCGPR